jgi:maltose-binding protein MalE
LQQHKAETSDNGQHTDFIIEANDAGVLAVQAGLLKDILIKFNFGGVDDYRL